MTSPAPWDRAWLEVDDFPLSTFAWWSDDYSPLLNSPPFRGGNEIMPGAPGRRAFLLIPDEMEFTLPLNVMGDVDEDNEPLEDHIQGVIDNTLAIKSGLGIPDGATGELKPAVFHLPNGSAWLTNMQVHGLFGTRDLTRGVRTTLDLVIPAGRWEQVESA